MKNMKVNFGSKVVEFINTPSAEVPTATVVPGAAVIKTDKLPQNISEILQLMEMAGVSV